LERAFNAWIGHSFPELGLILLYNNTFLRARMAEMTAVQLTRWFFRPSIGRAAYF
jgi:hypothetical protein